MRHALVVGVSLAAGLAPGLVARAEADGPVVRFATTLGTIDVQLLSDDAPQTVSNFMGYVNRGDYAGTFFHRSVNGFVIQAGGFRFSGGQPVAIPQQAPVINEFKVSNKRGTLAMAKLGNDPNSATNQWFFNESDANASNLDAQNGGFTVFGRITDSAGLNVMDAIATQRITDASATFGAPFNALPVFNYPTGNTPGADNLVVVDAITVLTRTPTADTKPPTIVSRRPRGNQHFIQGESVASDYSCYDADGSGVATCSGPATVDTAALGARTFKINASDQAGNQTSQTVTYYVDPAPAPSAPAGQAPPATTPPAGASPPPTADPVNVAPEVTGLVTTSPRGVVSLKLRCSGAVRCRGRMRLAAKGVVVGSIAYSVAAGRSVRLRVRLTTIGRRRLSRERGRLGVVLTLVPSGTGGRAVTRRLMLRIARRS